MESKSIANNKKTRKCWAFEAMPSRVYESPFVVNGGGGGIRTHGGENPTPIFKTGALDHSATPPYKYYSNQSS